MSDRKPSIFRQLSWALTYAFVVAGSAVLAAALVGMPLGDAYSTSARGLWPTVLWALSYGVLRSPVAAAEALLLAYLYRLGSGSWRLWGLGMALPVGLELVWQTFFGGSWLGEGLAWLWLWRQPPEFLLSLDLVLRNAFSELVAPFVAGTFVTWVARRQATM